MGFFLSLFMFIVTGIAGVIKKAYKKVMLSFG